MQSELAQAVYANLRLGANTRADLQPNNSRINNSLANYLSTRYTVRAIHNDPLTGAYAVLFLDTQTQQQTFAIRGTKGAGDVLADLHLLVGIPAWMSLQYQSLVSTQLGSVHHSLAPWLADIPTVNASAH